MSVSELMLLVNSNAREPLNFNQYLTDIGTFGANSYVLAKENEKLFRQMLKSSSALFGHKAIHQIVYDRLTAEDVDYMLARNTKLGVDLNSFYNRETNFVNGGIDMVLQNMTTKDYLRIENKFREGICRYIENKMKSDNIGQWLSELFEKSCFENFKTVKEIIADSECKNAIQNEERIGIVFINNKQFYDNADIDMLINLAPYIINTLSSSTRLIDSYYQNNKLDVLFGNEQIVYALSSNKVTVQAIIENNYALKALVSSTHFSNAFSKYSELYDGIMNAMQEYVLCKQYLESVKKNANEINTANAQLSRLTSCKQLLDNSVQSIDTALTKVNDVLSVFDIVMSNMVTTLKSDGFKKVLQTANFELLNKVFSNDAICKAFFAKDGPLLYYSTNNKEIIASLLANCSSFLKYINSVAKTTSAMTYTNTTKEFIILGFEWESMTTVCDFYAAGKNFYKYKERNVCELVTGFFYLVDTMTSMNGFSSALNMIFAKNGYFEMNAKYNTKRNITYYLIE